MENINEIIDSINEIIDSIKEINDKINKIENRKINNYNKRLCGSIAYNYIKCVAYFVYENKTYKKLPHLYKIKYIEYEEKDEYEENRWNIFKKIYWNDEFEEILKILTGGRFDISYPIMLNEEDNMDENDNDNNKIPSTKDLHEIILKVYIDKKYENFRNIVDKLINKLDLLSQYIKKPLFF